MLQHKTKSRWSTAVLSTLVIASVAASGASAGTPSGTPRAAQTQSASDRPPIHPLPGPGHFARHVTNRYLPWKPGTRWVFRGFGSEGHQRTVVQVLHRTKNIKGITATVVRDIVRSTSGRLIERTFDWYAQDDRGRVWYLGENSHAYEHGQVSTYGSWETGVDGAKPGIAMFRHPRIDVRYWQEFYRGVAEDQGTLLDRSTKTTVAAGHYTHVRMTEDTSPVEPTAIEFKFYAPKVGVVLEMDASPEQGRVELVRMVKP